MKIYADIPFPIVECSRCSMEIPNDILIPESQILCKICTKSVEKEKETERWKTFVENAKQKVLKLSDNGR